MPRKTHKKGSKQQRKRVVPKVDLRKRRKVKARPRSEYAQMKDFINRCADIGVPGSVIGAAMSVGMHRDK